jgi:chromosome partitioning protein
MESTNSTGQKTNREGVVKDSVQKQKLERQPYMITPSELSKSMGVTQAAISKHFSGYNLPHITGRSLGIPTHLVREYMKGKGHKFEKLVVAHINMRGGIGKTTSTISAACRAAQYGYNTVVVDLDSQGSASQAFNLEPEEDDDLFIDVWNKGKDEIKNSLKKVQDNLFVLPSSLENGLLDSSLQKPGDQKTAVQKVCDKIQSKNFGLIDDGVDLIFIDCPPSLGAAIISTICAADIVVIPVQSDAFSVKGLQLVLKEIKTICETFNIDAPDIKILYTAYDARKKQSVETMQKIVQEYGQYLVPTFIRSSTEFDKSIANKETIYASPRASQAKDDYDMYFKFLLDFGEDLKH